jgi:hypothetical protein
LTEPRIVTTNLHWMRLYATLQFCEVEVVVEEF